MSFFNLGLRGKILSLSFSAIILCLAVSGFGFWKSSLTMKDYKYIAEVNVPNLSSLLNMEINSVKIQSACNILIGTNSTKEDTAKVEKEITTYLKEFDVYVIEYEGLPFMDGEEAIWTKFKKEFWTRYVDAAKKIVALSGTGQSTDREARDRFAEETWMKLLSEKEAKFDELTSFQKSAVKTNSELASKSSAFLSWFIPLMFAILLLVTSVIVFSFTTKVTNQIQGYVNQLSQSAQSVLSESGNLSSASTQLASTTSEQSSAVQETSASVEEIKAMAGKNSDLANSSSEEALSLHKNAEDGKRIAEDLVGSMREISDSNNKISEAVQTSNVGLEKIVSMINEIATKTQVINDIVFQTKLLSFNASVEAARAGEHGKGFAVVAEEVGNLATMSGNAAKEIGQLLENSVSQVQQIAKETSSSTSTLLEVSKEKLNAGEHAVKASSETFTDMATKLSGIAQLASQISQASQEQVSGIAQIATAMENLSTSTHEIASASESTSSTSQLLRSQSEDLKLIAENLNAIISGQSHTVEAVASRQLNSNYSSNSQISDKSAA